MNSRKILGSTLTVASLTITALAGTSAFAVDNAAPSAVQSAASENSQNLPDIRARYVPKTIVLEENQLSNDPFPLKVTLRPEFYNAKTGEVVQAPSSKDFAILDDSVVTFDGLYKASINQETGEIELAVGQLSANHTFNF